MRATPGGGSGPRPGGGLCGDEGAGHGPSPPAPTAPSGAGHGALSGSRLSVVRDGSGSGRLPCRARTAGRLLEDRPVGHPRRGRCPRSVPLGQHARQSGRRPRRPGSCGRMGEGPRSSGGVRRVLRGVHLERAAAVDPPARQRRGAGRPLPVQAIQPGWAAGGLLRGRPRPGLVPAGDPQAPGVPDPRAGPGGRCGRPARPGPRRRPGRPLPPAPGGPGRRPRISGRGGGDAGGRLLPVGGCAGRRRDGPGASTGRRTGGADQPRHRVRPRRRRPGTGGGRGDRRRP